MELIFGIDKNRLEEILEENGFKKFRAKQIINWIYEKRVATFDEMKNLSKDLIAFLNENYYIKPLEFEEKVSSGKNTDKFLFNLKDSEKIEAVLMKYPNRNTLCISSQVGCKLACMFCATGRMGFTRDLTYQEIAYQIVEVERVENLKISNIVFMGMGEPLMNFDNLKKAINIINNPIYGINIGARKMTISTAGLPEVIKKLGSMNLQIKLAVSLNSPDQKQREFIMPIAKKHDLYDIIKSVKKYQKLTNRRVTFEYIMIDEVNDTMDFAREVVKLVSEVNCNINLIPYNKVYGCAFKPSNASKIENFKKELEKYGLTVNVRQSMGKKVAAACGQLSTKRKNGKKNEQR